MCEVVRYEGEADPRGLRTVEPKLPGVEVRLATQEDFAWIDALQKSESDGLGFQFESALRKRIEQGNILAAEVVDTQTGQAEPAGYCLGVDRYQKRGDLGIIYQIGVVKQYRRSLVAATLLQAQFDKSAYGTKLYCCWCKQSLAANRFWEAMGFVPLAFRAAGRSTIEKLRKKGGAAAVAGGVHLFWQKRIRVGDGGPGDASGGTPWWYPYETQGGAMMEGRVVLLLPPEVQWHEATPVVLPGAERRATETRLLEDQLSEVEKKERTAKKSLKGDHAQTQRGQDAHKAQQATSGGASRAVAVGGFGAGSGFGELPAPAGSKGGDASAEDKALLTKDEAEVARLEAQKAAAKKALKAAQRKNDPELVAYARELRDRWQEHVVAQPGMLEDKQRGRYVVGRLLGECAQEIGERTRVVESENEQPKRLPRAA